MPDLSLNLHSGGAVTITVPEPGQGDSCFLISFPKAGSTLFYRLMQPVAIQAGLAFFSLPNALYDIGLPAMRFESDLSAIFQPRGYAYGGFRGIEPPIELPAFASGRTIFLMRDPRDLLTSLYFSEAFSHVAPGTAVDNRLAADFEARRNVALAGSIDDFIDRRSPSVLEFLNHTLRQLDAIEHKTYRYEDIIFDKGAWVRDMVGYLGWTVAERAIDRIVERHDLRPSAEDVGQHVRKVTPGDHREKLRPETIAMIEQRFAPIMERFGY